MAQSFCSLGTVTHRNGAALIVCREKAKALIEWEPISDRLIRARLDSRYCKLTIIQCYAPTNDADEEKKDEWYVQVRLAIAKVPQHDMLIIVEDMNAKVGADNTNKERAMGRHGAGEMNDNGDHLASLCMNNVYIIIRTIFPHKDIHKLTWRSLDSQPDRPHGHQQQVETVPTGCESVPPS